MGHLEVSRILTVTVNQLGVEQYDDNTYGLWHLCVACVAKQNKHVSGEDCFKGKKSVPMDAHWIYYVKFRQKSLIVHKSV